MSLEYCTLYNRIDKLDIVFTILYNVGELCAKICFFCWMWIVLGDSMSMTSYSWDNYRWIVDTRSTNFDCVCTIIYDYHLTDVYFTLNEFAFVEKIV